MSTATPSAAILSVCRLLHQKNFLAAADGNVSLRTGPDEILITPSGKNKAFLEEGELARITPDNRILSGSPSGERLMHLEVYRRAEKAVAVVHAHPPTAIAFSVAFPEMKELPYDCLSEVILAVGRVPIANYARPGTQAMGDVLREFLPQNRVMILARHGALAWGESLQEAYNGIERLEAICQILLFAHQLGGWSRLSKSEVDALFALRQQLGEKIL